MHFHEFLFQGFPVLQLEEEGEEGGSRFSKVANPVQRWRGRVAGPPQSLIIRMVGIIVTWWPLWRQVTLPPQPAATTCDITIVGFGEEGEQEVSIVTTIIVTNGDSPFHTSDMWCWVYTVQPTWVFSNHCECQPHHRWALLESSLAMLSSARANPICGSRWIM